MLKENDQFRVLIVATNFIEKWDKLELVCKENLAVNSLASYLMSKNYDVTAINAQLEDMNNNEVLDSIQNSRFDLIGVSCSPQKLYTSSKDFVIKARKAYPSAFIVMGGIFPSSSYKEILKDLPELDAVLLGEGEFSLENLCRHIQIGNVNNLSDIPGIAYTMNDELIVVPPKRIEDLDLLPFPLRDPRAFSQIDGIKAYMIAGRGCYGNCSFCSIQSAYNYKKRICRSAKNVVDEIQLLIENYGVTFIQFHDDIFYDYSPQNQKWLHEFISLVRERNLKFKFRIYLRPNDIRENEICRLKSIGLDTVFIGAESGVQRILNEMNKRVSPEQIRNSVEILKRCGVSVSLGFITIVPTMSYDELKENYEFIYSIGECSDANLHNRLNIYYGCTYEKTLNNLGLLLEREHFWEIHSYKFLDKRVELYHDQLQVVKLYAKPTKKQENIILRILNTKGDTTRASEIESINTDAWIKATKLLLDVVENHPLYEKLTNYEMKNIYEVFDNLSKHYSNILDEIS